jgi:hypothetical protein
MIHLINMIEIDGTVVYNFHGASLRCSSACIVTEGPMKVNGNGPEALKRNGVSGIITGTARSRA